MSNRCRDRIGHRVVSAIATVATLAAGCASQPAAPPEQLSPIAPGDTPLSIVERGYDLVAVYQFVLDDHRYAFAGAYGNNKGYDLVFFDGHLGCTHETALTDLTDWEWVAESDGLQYLASRLRQACGLEEATTARAPPQPEASESEPPDEVQSAERPADGALDDFFNDHPLTEAIVGGFVGSLVITAGLLWGPVLWVPGAIYESARNAEANQAGRQSEPLSRD